MPCDSEVNIDRPVDGRDTLALLLTSPNERCNIFSADAPSLVELLTGHSIDTEFLIDPDAYRVALLTHLFSGACVGSAATHSGCHQFSSEFDDAYHMAYFVLSLVLSSATVLCSSLLFSAEALGISVDTSRADDLVVEDVRARLSEKRRALIGQYSVNHPSNVLLDNIEYMNLPALVSLAGLHRVSVYRPTLEGLRNSLTRHLASGACALQSASPSLACASVFTQTFPVYQSEAVEFEDRQQQTQIQLLSYLMPTLTRRTCRRILTLHDVRWKNDDGVARLRDHLRKYLKRLNNGKQSRVIPAKKSRTVAVETDRLQAKSLRMQESDRLKTEWPRLVTPALKQKFKDVFTNFISKESQATFICGCCGESCNVLDQKTTIGFDDFDFNQLRRPDLLDDYRDGPSDSDDDSESEDDTHHSSSESEDRPWLYPDMIPPPMPVDEDGPYPEYSTLLIDPECIEQDPDLMEDVLVACKVCRRELISGKAKQKPPRCAMANKNYLGPVPPELRDLSVVEEAMIARCRAKCWIIQM
jgi:hypothetical protein